MVLIGAFIFLKLPGLMKQAEIGAAYGARMGCSCHFVQGRSADSCVSDFEPGMSMVDLDVDDTAKSVTASFSVLASRTAKYTPTNGCNLEPEG